MWLAFFIVITTLFLDVNGSPIPDKDWIDTSFVLGTSCLIENSISVAECGKCWENIGAPLLSEAGIIGTKKCTAEYLPNINLECQDELDLLVPDNTQQGRKVFKCFVKYVKENDIDKTVQTQVKTWLMKQKESSPETKKNLNNDEADDHDFVVGSACTIESIQGGSIQTDRIEKCGACWEKVGNSATEETIFGVRNCTEKFLPNIYTACNKQIQQFTLENIQNSKEVFKCFLEYVKDTDQDGSIQTGVRNWLKEDKAAENEKLVIGSVCTIENLEKGKQKMEECGACWAATGNIITTRGLVKLKKCITDFLPSVDQACNDEIKGLRPNDKKQRKEIFKCFLRFVNKNDQDGSIQSGVKQWLKEDKEAEDDEFVIGSACTIESFNGTNIQQDRIQDCATCWEKAGHTFSQEGWIKLKKCSQDYLPNINNACNKDIQLLQPGNFVQGKVVFKCFLKYVRENDPNGLIQDGVRKWLDEDKEAEDTKFVVGSVCTIESFEGGVFNQDRIEKCGSCWEEAGDPLSFNGLINVKKCIKDYLPNINKYCKTNLEKMTANDREEGKEVFKCFLKYVKKHDKDEGIQNGVRKWVEEDNEAEDGEFVVGSVCTIESIEGSVVHHSKIKECANCWENSGDILSPQGLNKVKKCIKNHLPNINDACESDLEKLEPRDVKQGKEVFKCFLRYVKKNDNKGLIQNGVKNWLQLDKEAEDEHFVVGSACTIEGFDGGVMNKDQIEDCGDCWKDGFGKTVECTQEYLPNINKYCKGELNQLKSSNDDKQEKEVLKCFLRYVKEKDQTGDIQKGVKLWLKYNVDE